MEGGLDKLIQAFIESYYIVIIHLTDDIIKIGSGGVLFKNIRLTNNGFIIFTSDNLTWYNYNDIKKIECLGVKV